MTDTAAGIADDAVRFVLDGEVREVADCDPNETVLEYLRTRLGRTGTKEGCAEGDCGACTVVLGEPRNGGIRYRAVNACIQFLPTLHGRELFTVENLKGPDGRLHPVQEAMVACHGSQCGFCTPGFVMSLFALYKSEPAPPRRRLDDVLAGNLCRCTGYRPIIAAAEEMYRLGAGREPGEHTRLSLPHGAEPEGPAAEEERAARDRLESIRPRRGLSVSGRAPWGNRRRYFAPATVAELAAALEEDPRACILAGGTDVGLWVTKQHRDLDHVIYVGQVAELDRIEVAGDRLEIGAAVTLTDAHAALVDRFPDLDELFRRFASPPIRNAGTLVGNIANGSPIGDSMPALIALGADLLLRRGEATRVLPLDEFYLDYQKNALAPGEFVERVRVPLATDGGRFRTYKVSKRFDQDISAVCAAFSLSLDGDVARGVRVAFGGMAVIPKRGLGCERALEGRTWDEAAVAAGAAALDEDFAPITDMRASDRYRRRVARNLLRRFLLETAGGGAPTRVEAVAGVAS